MTKSTRKELNNNAYIIASAVLWLIYMFILKAKFTMFGSLAITCSLLAMLMSINTQVAIEVKKWVRDDDTYVELMGACSLPVLVFLFIAKEGHSPLWVGIALTCVFLSIVYYIASVRYNLRNGNRGEVFKERVKAVSMFRARSFLVVCISFCIVIPMFVRPIIRSTNKEIIPWSNERTLSANYDKLAVLMDENEVEKKTKENEQLFLNVVSSLAGAIDAKDTYTNGHSSRVAEYAKEIARRYGYNLKEQSDIYIIGLLHDVGKIGVPDTIINKPDKLTEEEFNEIKKHPVIGSQILKNINEMPKLSIGARWHHERYDGTGYPDGLAGEEIPEEARIIAVADSYDAMSSNRSYRSIISQDHIKEELINGSGTQFDPRFAEIMLKMIEEDKDFTMREGGRD